MNVRVRAATVPELPAVLNVLDGGLLETDATEVRAAIDDGDVLVAVAGEGETSGERNGTADRILGALVLDGAAVEAVAVRRRRRGQGIGTRLVESAADDRDRLVARFDSRVRPFWASLGFEIVEGDDGRCSAVRN